MWIFSGERKIKGLANEVRDVEKLVENSEPEKIEEKINSEEESEEEEENGEENFPDTKIELSYENKLPDEEVIFLGDNTPLVVKFKDPVENKPQKKE